MFKKVVPLTMMDEFHTVTAPPWPPALLVNVQSSTRTTDDSLA